MPKGISKDFEKQKKKLTGEVARMGFDPALAGCRLEVGLMKHFEFGFRNRILFRIKQFQILNS